MKAFNKNKKNNNFRRNLNPIRNRMRRRNYRRNNRFRKQINQIKRIENRKNKEQNKKINSLQQQMKNLTINSNISLTPFFKKMKSYIHALVNPELFVNSGIKIPNPLNTYSFCYGFKEQFNISISNNGSFALVWYPNFFSCDSKTIGGMTTSGGPRLNVNNQNFTFLVSRRFLVGQYGGNNWVWATPTSHVMTTPMEGYRLVSASITLRYIGRNIAKSGYILSIPTYKDIPAFASVQAENIPNGIRYDAIPNYDENIMNNTRGVMTQYILNNNFVKRLYVPLDSFDTSFEDPGFFYSTTQSQQGYKKYANWQEAVDANEVCYGTNNNEKFRILKPEEGNPIKYVFLGKGFEPDAEEVINVTAFYNFECIPVEGVVTPNNSSGKYYKLKLPIQEKIFNKLKKVVVEHPEKLNEKNFENKLLESID